MINLSALSFYEPDEVKNVLMLGWEFPPLINGGLGIACLGLGKALAKHSHLTFILPKTDPKFVVDQVELLGLNNLTIEEVERLTDTTEFSSFSEVEVVEASLLPYGKVEETELKDRRMLESRETKETKESREVVTEVRHPLEMFQTDSLYGDDVNAKVIEYARAAAAIADFREFDIIHAHDWMTFLAGMEIKKRSGKPLVLHVHSLSYDRAGPESRGWVYEIEKRAMEEADAIIPVSFYTGTIVTGHYGIDEKKVHPIHNGADPVKTFRTEKPFPEKLVLFLGRLTAQKGPEFFLEIAARVLKKNKNVRFVMAGTGEKLKQLIEFGAYHLVGDRFHFTGFLDKEKVNELLSMTDVYAMPSVSEPFGLSALEAAQFGIPAVISKQSGCAEVLTGALKADYWDVEKLADHICTLLDDPEVYARATAASLEDQKNCTWDATAEKVNEVYDHLIA